MAAQTTSSILIAVLGTALPLCAQSPVRSGSATISFRAEVAKVLKLQAAQRVVEQDGVSAEVLTLGPSTLKVAVRISGLSPVLRLPVAITANVRSFLLQARTLSQEPLAVIGLADSSGQDGLGRRIISRALPLDRDPVFAMVSAPSLTAGSSDTTIELRFDPVPSGESRLVTFELSLLESGR